MANAAAPPNNDTIADKDGHCTQAWLLWFTDIIAQLANSTAQVAQIGLTGQNASIAATDLTSGTTSAGLYKVEEYQRVTTAAGTSSSLTFVLNYTDHGQAMTFTGVAMTGNTVTTAQSNVFVFYSDGGTPIRYSYTYASNAAAVMVFESYLVLSSVNV